jgi:hypothetical protein
LVWAATSRWAFADACTLYLQAKLSTTSTTQLCRYMFISFCAEHPVYSYLTIAVTPNSRLFCSNARCTKTRTPHARPGVWDPPDRRCTTGCGQNQDGNGEQANGDGNGNGEQASQRGWEWEWRTGAPNGRPCPTGWPMRRRRRHALCRRRKKSKSSPARGQDENGNENVNSRKPRWNGNGRTRNGAAYPLES